MLVNLPEFARTSFVYLDVENRLSVSLQTRESYFGASYRFSFDSILNAQTTPAITPTLASVRSLNAPVKFLTSI